MTSFSEFIDKCKVMEDGYVVAAMTDRYVVDSWPNSNDEIIEDKLLEMRVFNETQELKLYRSDISKDFICRVINDKSNEELDYSDYSDEYQYLDIDTKRSKKSFEKNQMVRTTGGGIYRLPMSNMDDVMVHIRMYYNKYPETGQARVFDWRAVDFVEESIVNERRKKDAKE